MQAKLLHLKSTLEQAQANTLQMKQNIVAFENRLSDLDESMRPVQRATAPLSRARKNIGRALVVIEKMTEYFKITPEVTPIISIGFRDNDSSSHFFEAVDRLITAKKFFSEHMYIKTSEKALADVVNVLTKAVSTCISELNKILSSTPPLIEENLLIGKQNFRSAKTIPVNINISRLIGVCECIGQCSDGAQYHTYAQGRVEKVRADIIQMFHSVCVTSAMLHQFELATSTTSTNPAALKSSTVATSQNFSTLSWASLFQHLPYDRGTHPFRVYYSIVIAAIKGEYCLWVASINMCQDHMLDGETEGDEIPMPPYSADDDDGLGSPGSVTSRDAERIALAENIKNTKTRLEKARLVVGLDQAYNNTHTPTHIHRIMRLAIRITQ